MDLVRVGALSLHTLALLIVLGYYGILGRFALPTLRGSLDPPTTARVLGALERRARPWLVLTVVLFTLTGTYLLFVDEQYAGLGVITGAWAGLLLVKHVLVVVVVGLGVAVDRLIAEVEASEGDAVGALRLAGFAAEVVTVLGALTIVLTAAAQLAPS
jgi:uncharacterized membrane protein